MFKYIFCCCEHNNCCNDNNTEEIVDNSVRSSVVVTQPPRSNSVRRSTQRSSQHILNPQPALQINQGTSTRSLSRTSPAERSNSNCAAEPVKPNHNQASLSNTCQTQQEWERWQSRKHTNELDSKKSTLHEKRASIKSNARSNVEPAWQIFEVLHEEHNIGLTAAGKLEKLFAEGNTIPFISRHRKDVIGPMTTEKLRNVKGSYDRALALRLDIMKAYSNIMELKMMSKELRLALMITRSRETLDEVYAPYKTIIAEKASVERQSLAVFEESANMILQGRWPTFTSADIIRITATKIFSSPGSLEYLQNMSKNYQCILRCDQIKENFGKNEKSNIGHKFKCYFNRSFNTKDLKPHQILAINRAEKFELITVTVLLADFSHKYCNKMRQHFSEAMMGPCANVFVQSLDLCYETSAVPLLQRMKRAILTSIAEKAAVDIYSSNLKQLLLTTPVKNKRILGVDPGTSLGCKLGLVSETGEVLATGVVYPNAKKRELQKQKFRNILKKHYCSLIAIGNGTGCRDAEEWIADMIACDYFAPLRVSYTIVNESGASIYSCSKEAISEFQNMDPNLIGAISLARRVQDPLSEYCKVEPCHMGIGMYQHDVNPGCLKRALADVVSECVSFAGVDVNTASQCLLQHVAGLSKSLANEIVAHRNLHGHFAQREEIYEVHGINTLTYKQCAGFLKIFNGANKLDETGIHPESYYVVQRIVAYLQMRPNQVGTGTFRAKVKKLRGIFMVRPQALGTSKERLECILDELNEENHVIKAAHCVRLFRSDIKHIDDLEVSTQLTGAVVNVTTFGSFVDVGVGTEGLLHVNQTNSLQLRIGNRVKVEVCNLDTNSKRIGLKLIKVL